MEILIWVLQILMALLFLFVGISKMFLPKPHLLEKGMKGLKNLDPTFIKVAGVLEMLGALGLVFPQWLGIFPVLTGVSALCLALTMLPAGFLHYQLKESLVANVVVFVACLGIAWFRLGC